MSDDPFYLSSKLEELRNVHGELHLQTELAESLVRYVKVIETAYFSYKNLVESLDTIINPKEPQHENQQKRPSDSNLS